MNENCMNRVVSDDYVDFLLDYDLAPEDVLNSNNICRIPIDNIIQSIYVPKQILPEDVLGTYGYKVFPRLYGLLSMASLEASGVTKLRNIPGLDLLGTGVLVGIVDTGIDYTHKAFINADGTTRILSIWDQTIQSGPTPVGLTFGTEFTREQINNALQSNNPIETVPSVDEVGHGTFIAGTTAGNVDNEMNFSGVVPGSELVVVKLKQAKQYYRDLYVMPDNAVCYQENDIMLGIRYLLDVAVKYNRPISICIGLGTSQGAHDENGALSSYISRLAQTNGVVITVAAGNEGSSKNHYESTLTTATDDTVELNVGTGEKGFIMEIWGDAPSTYAVSITTPSGEVIPVIFPRLNERRELSFIFETTQIAMLFQLVGSRSGAQLVILRFANPSEGIWKITITKTNKTLDLHYNIWLPMSRFISSETYFLRPSPYTTLTSPANTYLPIVVNAYDVANKSLYINASRGYTRTKLTAPCLAAPGVNYLGPASGNTYTTMSGTSIAAAFTAGVAAMLLEWGMIRGNINYMDCSDVKNLLIRGAKRESNMTYPNREVGFGILDIFGAYQNLRGTS